MLDNIWCGVPCVVTSGDVLADLVVAEGIGEVTPPGDAAAVADAILTALEPDRARATRATLASLAGRHTWERVAGPLLAYCRDPWALGSSRGGDATAAYLHQLERLYSETAQYARRLEDTVARKDQALAEMTTAASRPPVRARTRPDLGALFRRQKRG